MKIRTPGEIWLADLGLAAKHRPVLIVSRADPDPPRVLYVYVPSPRRTEATPTKSTLASCLSCAEAVDP